MISAQTRTNWVLDAMVFIGGLMAAITGIYFLILPVGGYQGGRNALYGVRFLFDRNTWNDLHTWAGVALIIGATIHLAYHWKWVVSMARRTVRTVLSRKPAISKGAWGNLAINAVMALSFLLTAASGIYFLFAPVRGGGLEASNTVFLFSRATWDLIHTWGGVGMVIAAMLHFVIHWRWIKNVAARLFRVRMPRTQAQRVLVGK